MPRAAEAWRGQAEAPRAWVLGAMVAPAAGREVMRAAAAPEAEVAARVRTVVGAARAVGVALAARPGARGRAVGAAVPVRAAPVGLLERAGAVAAGQAAPAARHPVSKGTTTCANDFTPSRCNAAGAWENQPRCTGIQICASGACGTICPLTRPNDCVDITHLRSCVNGQVTSTDCGIGNVCFPDHCVPNMT